MERNFEALAYLFFAMLSLFFTLFFKKGQKGKKEKKGKKAKRDRREPTKKPDTPFYRGLEGFFLVFWKAKNGKIRQKNAKNR